MDDLRTFEFGADIEMLKGAYEKGTLPGHLEAPFRAMVTDIVTRIGEKPVSIYLCSPEEDAEARNLMGFFLTRLVREHIPTVLLVDCDFLSTGMTGIVPHRDALGFLDLLLYGTSLGVIAQEGEHGVRIIGAGSFPVTKKNPFAIDAFESARRYLANQAKCVIFCGPVQDDEDHLHPLAEAVDLAALVRMADHFDPRFLDPFEEKISSTGVGEAWSVRLDKSIPVDHSVPEIEAPENPEVGKDKQQPTLVAEVEELVERAGLVETPEEKPVPKPQAPEVKAPQAEESSKPAPPKAKAPEPVAPKAKIPRESDVPEAQAPKAQAPQAKAPKAQAPRVDKRPSAAAQPSDPRWEETEAKSLAGPRRFNGSRVFRLAILSVAVMLVVFVFWWLFLTKPVREREQAATEPAERTGQAIPETVVADTTGTGGAQEQAATDIPTETAPGEEVVEKVEEGRPVDVGEGSGAIPKPDRVEVRETLDQYANQYLIHVSSFREVENAQDEAFYLLGWGYPVFIYRADLGSKGMWYRVYVGPSMTREDAMKHKIKLDENRRIKSTRIARVPG